MIKGKNNNLQNTPLVTWCFAPSQLLGVTSGLTKHIAREAIKWRGDKLDEKG